MPFETLEQAEGAVNAAKALYLEVINKAVEDAGSVYALAKQLNKNESSIRAVINRKEFGPVRRLANRISDNE